VWAARRRSKARTWTPDEHQEAVRHFGRLMLVACAGMAVGLYADSPGAAADPWGTKRYLMSLLIALPAAIAPLCGAVGSRPFSLRRSAWGRGLGRGLEYVGLAFMGGILLLGTVATFQEVAGSQRVDAQYQHLTASLESRGLTRIYSEYWTCNRVMFQTQERVMCAVLDGNLNPGQDRYMLYPAMVRAAPDPAYVLPIGSAQAVAFARRAARPGAHYHHVVVEGYVIYWSDPAK
jgi:hypothetical protein